MATLNDLDLITVVNYWSDEAAFDCSLRHRSHSIHRRQGSSGSLNAARLQSDLTTNFQEQFSFQLHDPLFGAENLLFPVFQFRSRITLRIGKCLSHFIILW